MTRPVRTIEQQRAFYLKELDGRTETVGEMQDRLKDMWENWDKTEVAGVYGGPAYILFTKYEKGAKRVHFHVISGDLSRDVEDQGVSGLPYESIVQGFTNFEGIRLQIWGPESHCDDRYWSGGDDGWRTPRETLVFPPEGHFEHMEMAGVALVAAAVNEAVVKAWPEEEWREGSAFRPFTVAVKQRT